MLRPRSRWLAPVVLLLIGALVSVACGSSSGSEADRALATAAASDEATASTDPVVAETTSTTSAPCPATVGQWLTTADGRRAMVRGAEPSPSAPAVLVLHGYTGTPASIESTSGWNAFAESVGAVVLYPEGRPVPTSTGDAWATGSRRFSLPDGDDTAFLIDLVRELSAGGCIDPSHVLLTGESNGGAMALKAACDPRSAGVFTAVVPVIPAVDDRVTATCGEGPPIPLLTIASTKDRTVDYLGRYPAGQVSLEAQETWFQRVAVRLNRCEPGAPPRRTIDDAEVLSPDGCASATELVAVVDGVHTWPGGPTGTGGLSPGRFPATRYLWSWLGWGEG